ncbi:MAG TPA: hypothetical protein EYO72_03555 [Marine Group III euryarchaeote]|nr:hypothetical protein [Marine Group III euryarchaeote]
MTEDDYVTAREALAVDDEIFGVTHAEAMAFAESYNKGWDAIKRKWEIVIAVGIFVVFIGFVTMFFAEELFIIGIVSIFFGFIAIVIGYDKLKHVKVAQKFMLEANIRLRAKR